MKKKKTMYIAVTPSNIITDFTTLQLDGNDEPWPGSNGSLSTSDIWDPLKLAPDDKQGSS